VRHLPCLAITGLLDKLLQPHLRAILLACYAVGAGSLIIEKEPAWRNERWVAALYGTAVAANIARDSGRRERRLEAERKGQTRPPT
jgi:hypothetical protein